MVRVIAFMICLSLAGCGAAPAREPPAVALGEEVTLAPGAMASVKTADMKVRFVAVTADSRCPSDVTCIWAGEVKVQLEILESSQAASRVEILGGSSTDAGAYRVTIVRVEPQPASTAPIAAQDYRVTLKVGSKAS